MDGWCVDGKDVELKAQSIVSLCFTLSLIPIPASRRQELHASSVQHPTYPHMRWFLPTKRVPVLQDSQGGRSVGAAEHTKQEAEGSHGGAGHAAAKASAAAPDIAVRPPCAGVGDLEQAAWLCHECAAHLCRKDPKMPPQAFANLIWGGRLRPWRRGRCSRRSWRCPRACGTGR